MKKAKTNVYCDGIQYIKGELYTEKEVKHLCQDDFETIEKQFVDEIPNKMVTLKDKKVKTK